VALAKAVLPHMLGQRSGRFVVVSSLSGKYGVPKLSAYAASKHALHGFFESLRTEVYQEGLRVTMVIPGFIRTDIIRKGTDGAGALRGRDLAVNERGMAPEECAEWIVRAIRSGKEEVLVGGIEMQSLLLLRLFPSVFRLLIRNNPIRRVRAVFGLGG
jgi:dehydrogenase/reductase SDR family member 7B